MTEVIDVSVSWQAQPVLHVQCGHLAQARGSGHSLHIRATSWKRDLPYAYHHIAANVGSSGCARSLRSRAMPTSESCIAFSCARLIETLPAPHRPPSPDLQESDMPASLVDVSTQPSTRGARPRNPLVMLPLPCSGLPTLTLSSAGPVQDTLCQYIGAGSRNSGHDLAPPTQRRFKKVTRYEIIPQSFPPWAGTY